MNEDTRNLLALLAGLNQTMGEAYLKLTASMTDGVLDSEQLRYLALIFEDMTALLIKHADQIDPPADAHPSVVEGVAVSRPAGAGDPTSRTGRASNPTRNPERGRS